MATCKFGADDQHLHGKARSNFMKKCMSDTGRAAGRFDGAGAPAPHTSNIDTTQPAIITDIDSGLFHRGKRS